MTTPYRAHHVFRQLFLTTGIAVLFLASVALFAPRANATIYCSDKSVHNASTATRSSRIELLACLETKVSAGKTVVVPEYWFVTTGTSALGGSVQFNSIKASVTYSSPTTDYAPAMSQPNLTTANTQYSYGTLNAGPSPMMTFAALHGWHTVVATVTYDVKDDGKPAFILSATKFQPL